MHCGRLNAISGPTLCLSHISAPLEASDDDQCCYEIAPMRLRRSSQIEDVVLDLSRRERVGFPEVVFGEGKTVETIAELVDLHQRQRRNLLVTRLEAEKVPSDLPVDAYDPVSRTLRLMLEEGRPAVGRVAVVAGGTSDAPVAREAAVTAEFLGFEADLHMDVGVAGLHRLASRVPELETADVIIAVAGFEAALASVVAGLFPQPVIGVPTSIGYGVAAGGRAALGSMLASCANGVVVVNIDNGYGAAVAAYRMLTLQGKR